MRYHWGQGIGHRYASTSMTTSETDSIHDEADEAENDQYLDLELDEDSEGASDTDESNNSELSLDDRDLEGWEDVGTSDSGSDSDCPSEQDSESDED
jgi:hypothetical protein